MRIRRITVDDDFDWINSCKEIIQTPTMYLFPLWAAHNAFTGWTHTLFEAVIESMGVSAFAMLFQILIVLLYLAPEHVKVYWESNAEGDN